MRRAFFRVAFLALRAFFFEAFLRAAILGFSPPWLDCSIAHGLCVFATSEPNSVLSLET